MRSPVNRPCKPSTTACFPLRTLSWRSLRAPACPPARLCRVFLAALDQASVESVRTLFQQDLLARSPFSDPGGITDRCGQSWHVADVDGTRQPARHRALPQTEALPAPHRRCDQVCAKGSQGRKRGEVVRTRTVVFQAHTHQFLGTFGEAGNGNARGELLRAIQVLKHYAKQVQIAPENLVVRKVD